MYFLLEKVDVQAGMWIYILEVKLLKRPHRPHGHLDAPRPNCPKLKMCNKILVTDSHASLEGVGGNPQGITVYRLIFNQKCMFDIFCFTGCFLRLKKSLSWKLSANPPIFHKSCLIMSWKSLPSHRGKMKGFRSGSLNFKNVPSRELTYPTLGKGKSSSKCHFWGIC